MHRMNPRLTVAALACALALLVGTVGAASAQTNQQSGLVNVNLQNLSLAIPVSASVPISVAANVCGLNILAIQQAGNTCTATSNSTALSQAVAAAMTGSGGGASNNQSGLVNVNVQNLALAVPVSVAVPVGVAANVCGVNVLSLQQAPNTCNATSTSSALSKAIGAALAGQ
ncbi:MAG TPA: hypothetical protein VFL91_06590 [Thermomicrobiales bacterium]|nr:hypothetical protein [Thermomicrobiales bacterium]